MPGAPDGWVHLADDWTQGNGYVCTRSKHARIDGDTWTTDRAQATCPVCIAQSVKGV